MELEQVINVFAIDENIGTLTELSITQYFLDDANPDDEQQGAEIAFHPTLPVIYISNRIYGSIVVFDVIDATRGELGQKQVNCFRGFLD